MTAESAEVPGAGWPLVVVWLTAESAQWAEPSGPQEGGDCGGGAVPLAGAGTKISGDGNLRERLVGGFSGSREHGWHTGF